MPCQTMLKPRSIQVCDDVVHVMGPEALGGGTMTSSNNLLAL